MATTQTPYTNTALDATFERVNEAGEQIAAVARKAGHFYLDTYEKAVERTIDLECKAADASQQQWLKNLVEAQADFARGITGSYTSSARTLLN